MHQAQASGLAIPWDGMALPRPNSVHIRRAKSRGRKIVGKSDFCHDGAAWNHPRLELEQPNIRKGVPRR